MKLLEYEAKHLINEHNIPVPSSFIVSPAADPEFLPAVIKSQVPTGGRGKAGGIAVVDSEKQYADAVERISQLQIKGFTPKTLLAEELVMIDKEFYLSLLIDTSAASIVLMAHKNGGVEVEENQAEDFFRRPISADTAETVADELADYFDLPDKSFVLQDLVEALFRCFCANDATLLELNPLIYTRDGKFVAGDCKMELDDAAAFRHPEWQFEQAKAEVNFVALDQNGTVATIANGAGLAMATVDAVADAGMTPANFLDIGGGANEASVLAAFERIVAFPSVKVIIINIFAGITRCDEIARAVIAAKSQITNLPPAYIRLAGTNFEQAVDILTDAGIPTLATLEECIQRAVKEVSHE
ncbi:MAG: hypothetical protein EOO17_00320 [Chloroflexi bacterium]|nr:MAG: hypothetical protein EOO17_00320 [Chloroflexota bacterium]